MCVMRVEYRIMLDNDYFQKCNLSGNFFKNIISLIINFKISSKFFLLISRECSTLAENYSQIS